MQAISFFTPVRDGGEQGICDNYFYMGGSIAQVYSGNLVTLERGEEWSCWDVAKKITMYILLLPLTIILGIVHSYYRSSHDFTVITPPEMAVLNNSPKSLILGKSSTENQEVTSKYSTQPPELRVYQDKKEDRYNLSTVEKVRTCAKELGERCNQDHCALSVTTFSLEQAHQRELFLSELRTIADVDEWPLDVIDRCFKKERFTVFPKVISQTNTEDKYTENVRVYQSGVREEREREGSWGENCWYGKRIYPNGIIQKGRFSRYRNEFESGVCTDRNSILYLDPDYYFSNSQRRLIDNGERFLIVQKGEEKWYSEVQGDLIDELIEVILGRQGGCLRVTEENRCRVFGNSNDSRGSIQPIDFRAFVERLFTTGKIFSFSKYSELPNILKLIQQFGISIDLTLRNRETDQTLLETYIDSIDVLKELLRCNPRLIQCAGRSYFAEACEKVLSAEKGRSSYSSFHPERETAAIFFKAMRDSGITLSDEEARLRDQVFVDSQIRSV